MKIGPTFLSELVAAGVSPDGLAWSPATGELMGDPDAIEAAQPVLDAHDPAKLPVVTMLTRKLIVSNMNDMGVLAAFIASKCKASDLERWQTYNDVPIDNPVMNRMMSKATPPIDPQAVFNYTGA